MIKLILLATAVSQIATAMPRDWYQLPEDPSNRTDAKPSEVTGLDRIVSAQTQALLKAEKMRKVTSRTFPYVFLSTDMGVTRDGVFGILPFNGTVSSTLYWRKEMQDLSKAPSAQKFTMVRSAEEAMKVAEQTLNLACQTRQLDCGKKQRQKYFDLVTEFVEVAQSLEQNPNQYWTVKAFYLDRGVSASGEIMPPATVGADIRLRMGWMVQAKSRDGLKPKQKQNLNELVRRTGGYRRRDATWKKLASALVSVWHWAVSEPQCRNCTRWREGAWAA